MNRLNGVVLILCGTLAYEARTESRITGNGGDVIWCDSGDPFKIKFLDVFEAELAQLKFSYPALQDPYELAGDILKRKTPWSRLQTYANLKTLDVIKTSSLWTRKLELPDIPDSNELIVPPGCRIRQIAIQGTNVENQLGKYFVFNQDLWDMLPVAEQAALLVHEVLYREAIAFGATDSVGIRALNKLLWQNKIDGSMSHKALMTQFWKWGQKWARIGGRAVWIGGANYDEQKSAPEFNEQGILTKANVVCSYGLEFSNLTLPRDILQWPEIEREKLKILDIGGISWGHAVYNNDECEERIVSEKAVYVAADSSIIELKSSPDYSFGVPFEFKSSQEITLDLPLGQKMTLSPGDWYVAGTGFGDIWFVNQRSAQLGKLSATLRWTDGSLKNLSGLKKVSFGDFEDNVRGRAFWSPTVRSFDFESPQQISFSPNEVSYRVRGVSAIKLFEWAEPYFDRRLNITTDFEQTTTIDDTSFVCEVGSVFSLLFRSDTPLVWFVSGKCHNQTPYYFGRDKLPFPIGSTMRLKGDPKLNGDAIFEAMPPSGWSIDIKVFSKRVKFYPKKIEFGDDNLRRHLPKYLVFDNAVSANGLENESEERFDLVLSPQRLEIDLDSFTNLKWENYHVTRSLSVDSATALPVCTNTNRNERRNLLKRDKPYVINAQRWSGQEGFNCFTIVND